MVDVVRLKQTFVDALGLSADTDVESLAYSSIREWDSVAHMRLVAAIETAFDVMLDTDDVLDMSSFERARQILEKHV